MSKDFLNWLTPLSDTLYSDDNSKEKNLYLDINYLAMVTWKNKFKWYNKPFLHNNPHLETLFMQKIIQQLDKTVAVYSPCSIFLIMEGVLSHPYLQAKKERLYLDRDTQDEQQWWAVLMLPGSSFSVKLCNSIYQWINLDHLDTKSIIFSSSHTPGTFSEKIAQDHPLSQTASCYVYTFHRYYIHMAVMSLSLQASVVLKKIDGDQTLCFPEIWRQTGLSTDQIATLMWLFLWKEVGLETKWYCPLGCDPLDIFRDFFQPLQCSIIDFSKKTIRWDVFFQMCRAMSKKEFNAILSLRKSAVENNLVDTSAHSSVFDRDFGRLGSLDEQTRHFAQGSYTDSEKNILYWKILYYDQNFIDDVIIKEVVKSYLQSIWCWTVLYYFSFGNGGRLDYRYDYRCPPLISDFEKLSADVSIFASGNAALPHKIYLPYEYAKYVFPPCPMDVKERLYHVEFMPFNSEKQSKINLWYLNKKDHPIILLFSAAEPLKYKSDEVARNNNFQPYKKQNS
ncbi:putative 5'-3' exonuclease [Namao virus]|nr:putative 5'-3' exonuclease [Namao virus]